MQRFICGLSVVVFTSAITVGIVAQERKPTPGSQIRKPQMSDTISASMYADNWFMLYINGELVAVDSIRFIPHNVVAVDILPSYPMKK